MKKLIGKTLLFLLPYDRVAKIMFKKEFNQFITDLSYERVEYPSTLEGEVKKCMDYLDNPCKGDQYEFFHKYSHLGLNCEKMSCTQKDQALWYIRALLSYLLWGYGESILIGLLEGENCMPIEWKKSTIGVISHKIKLVISNFWYGIKLFIKLIYAVKREDGIANVIRGAVNSGTPIDDSAKFPPYWEEWNKYFRYYQEIDNINILIERHPKLVKTML